MIEVFAHATEKENGKALSGNRYPEQIESEEL